MSYIDNLTQPAITTSTAGNSSSSKSKSDIMGKEDFLSLLVAQLQNQDPLNPENPTEFTAQLAQFSSLEQLFNLNESMENIVTSNANADRFATLQTIGKNVVYQDSKFEFEGEGEMELGYQLDGNASEVQITIKKDGTTVAVLDGSEMTKGNHFLTWDGMTESGDPAESGSYTFAISVKASEGESVAASPLIKSEVTGVDLTGEYGGKLLTKAGEVSFASVLGVYDIVKADEDSADEARDGFM
jgi:flagellar basal-body rod modification protein FlgD